ncbi:MAG: 50S ribosomal protein L33 [Culicoidibacterales bacterium]
MRKQEKGCEMSGKVLLICTDCLSRNYSVIKNKELQQKRLEIKKYCKRCNKHTLHKESR